MQKITSRLFFFLALLVTMLLSSLALAACGDAPTPVPPSPTPAPEFQAEVSPELAFTMSIPYGWTKQVVDANTIVYLNPADANMGFGVFSRSAQKLTPTSKELLKERTDFLRSRFPNIRVDENGGGSFRVVDNSINIDRLAYTNEKGVDVLQFIAQVNNVAALRPYVLFAVTGAKEVDIYQQRFLKAFGTFVSTAAPVASGQSGVTDPTVQAAQAGGKVISVGRDVLGRYLRLTEWETPPLDVSTEQKKPRLTGQFPVQYNWLISTFPTKQQPSITLTSPKVDQSSPEAVIRIGVYKDALPEGAPSREEWEKFYNPVRKQILESYIQTTGPNSKLEEFAQVGNIYRAAFITRDSNGGVLGQGYLYVSKSGKHGVVTLLTVSPQVALKPAVIDNFENDIRQLTNSIKVNY